MFSRSSRSLAICITLMFLVGTLLAGAAPRSSAAPPLSYPKIFLPLLQNNLNGLTEVVTARTATTRTFLGVVNGKPIMRVRKYAEPVYFLDPQSRQWLPIDTSIVRDQVSGTYRNAAADFEAHFAGNSIASAQSGAPTLLRLRRAGQPELAISAESGAALTPTTAGDTITYTKIGAQTDLVYHVRPWGIKEEVVLHSAAAAPSFALLLDAPGALVQPQPDGSWLIKSSAEQALWRIPAPYGTDAKGRAAPVTLKITPIGDRYRLTLAVDPRWLAAPDRAFPVRLDPSLADPHYFGGETYIQSATPTANTWDELYRFVGNTNAMSPSRGSTRIFTPVDFSFLPAGVGPAQLISAEVVFTQHQSNNSGGFNTSIYPAQQPWNFQTLTWATQPAIGAAITSAVHVAPTTVAQHWNITGWARQVLADSLPNYGLMIRADDETQAGGVFWSSSCGQLCPADARPYIEVAVAPGSTSSTLFGDGRDGDRLVPTGQTVTIDTVKVSVSAAASGAIPANSTGFGVGDLVYFHQTQGTANVGCGEFDQIAAINSPTSWTLATPLTCVYDSNIGRAQVIRVPQYHNVTVQSGGTLTTPAWDGSSGGILIFLANGDVNVDGSIRVSGNGFRGGARGEQSGDQYWANGMDGEGAPRASLRIADNNQANGNGGGPGDYYTSAAYPVACGDGSGGGGGGNGTPGENGGEVSGGLNSGGRGGNIAGSSDLTTAAFGGGGGGGGSGGGGSCGSQGFDGGNGGGMIFLFAPQININGSLEANGNRGCGPHCDGRSQAWDEGAGGSGAGGSILIRGSEIQVGANRISAIGGTTVTKSNGAPNTGGAGGVGRIRVEYCGTLSGTTNPPASVQQINCYTQPIDSGLNPVLDTWAFPNRTGRPSFEQYAKDYGVPATTYLVTETHTLQVISNTTSLTLPISFATAGLTPTLPLTPTQGITATGDISGSVRIPQPIAYLYEEVIVKAVYDDQFTQYYKAALEGGLCAGMATTVADLHSSGGPSPAKYGGTTTVRSIPNARPAQEYIEQLHGRQVSSQVLNWLASQGRTDAVGLYNRLVARLGTPDWWTNPEIIGIIRGSNCQDVEVGHALLPYKIVPQSGGQARIYVYDPNYSPSSSADSDNHYILIDLNANTWSYELAPASDTHPAITWLGSSIYTTPLSLFREKPILPHQSGKDAMLIEGGHSVAYGQGGLKSFGGHSVAYGEGDDGLKTGCYIDDSGPTFVQEISRTLRVTPITGIYGGHDFPDTLLFPSGQNWTFTGSGARTGHLGDMMLFGPHALAGFLSAAGDTTRDSARIDAAFQSLTLRTNDTSKPVSAYQMHETDGWTRIYAVSNTTLGAGEVLTLTVDPALDHFEVVNSAAVSKTMDLGLGQIGGAAIGTIVYPRQPIGAHERRIYTPIDWRDLPHSPIRVDIDLNNDGSIDRSEVLGGAVFPAATLVSSVPATPGQVFPIITHTQLAPGQFGWVNLDHPLAPGATPTNAMMGDESAIRAWLQSTTNPGLLPGAGLVGIPGTHGGIFAAIGTPTPSEEQLYHVGDTMLVPLYDHIIPRQGSQPLYYHLAGFAVVRITASTNSGGDDAACLSNPACNKRVMGELLAKITY